MNKIQKRAFAFTLAVILIFVQEIPVYAEGISVLTQRIANKRQEDMTEQNALAAQEALFASKEPVTLSDNTAPANADGAAGGTQTTGTQTGETRTTGTQTGETQTAGGDDADSANLRMPEIDPHTNPDLIYGTPVEIARNYRTYQNPDGTYTTVFTSYPNTYIDGAEEKPIDNTLVSENAALPQTYTNKQNEIQITLPAGENPNHTVTVDDGQTRAQLCPEDGNYTMETISENAIRYNDVYENIDVQYTVQPCGLKQDIILNAPQDKTDFTYTLAKEGVRAELKDNTIYIYRDDTVSDAVSGNSAESDRATLDGNAAAGTVSGNFDDSEDETPEMIISAPRMQDAAGLTSDAITLSLDETEDGYRITISADSEWLQAQERTYPVKIDPDVTILQTEIDQFTISSLAGPDRENFYSCCGFFDSLGKTRTYIITTFLYQAIAGGKKDIEILSAQLEVYQLNETEGFDIRCYRLNESLYYQDITWDNSVNIDRYAAGEDISKPAGEGWHVFDVRDSVNGWFNGTYESHGLVLIASDETKPGAIFATENYPDSVYAPTLTINWQEAGDVPADYGIDDTTITLRPMTLSTTDGKLQCYGVFADGLAKPGAVLEYQLSDSGKNYNGMLLLTNEKKYPDSAAFQSAFPAGTIRYKDAKSNWQTAVPFTEFDYDTPYTITAQAAYRDQKGTEEKSDEFLIYRVTRYDTMNKIADYYGVPLATLLFDNKAADTLLVENNTLFIRNPQKNKNTPYQPAELTDEEKAEIDSALLGRALHCEFGFEPVNLNTGNFYLAQEDFSYTDALGTFALQRSYNAENAGRLGSFGRGFTSLFDESLGALSDGTLIYNREDGSSLYFHPDGKGGYQTPEGYQLSLTKTKTAQKTAEFSDGEQTYDIYRYDITREDDSVVTFDEKGNLLQIRQKNGAVLTMNRDSGGSLVSITREGVTMPVTTTADGMIASVTMPNGGTFRYSYDAAQNLVSVTNPMGNAKRFVYDSSHRMTAWYDENNTRIVQNTYDSQGRVIRQLDENGAEIRLTYRTGATETTDANGNTTVYEYDDCYRTTAIRYPDGTTETRQYRDNLLTTQTDRAGTETAYEYDADGNITRKQVGEIVNTFTYDARGNLTGTTDPEGNTVKAEYDAYDNLMKTTDAEGNTTLYAYDSRNRLVKTTDSEGNATTYTYSGNYPAQIQINGRVTDRFSYNALGQILSHTDGAGNTVSYTYDVLGRNIAVKTAEGNTTNIAYDPIGLVTSVTDPLGGVTAYTYNKSNDILSVTDPMGNRALYTYDANGNRLSETDPEGNRTEYAYDAMNRLITMTDSLGGVYTYEYDNRDNVTKLTDPAGNSVGITYDAYYGQPLSMTDAEGAVTGYAYDKNGNLISVVKNGITLEAYEYDQNNRNIKAAYAGGLIQSFTYDKNGNCTRQTDNGGRNRLFAYDDENRLIQETTADGQEYRYTYDGAGNLISVAAPEGMTQTYTYDGDGNLLTETDGEGNISVYTYDGNGNLTEETLPNGTKLHYSYDSLGRLISSADGRNYLTAYEYDKTGNLTGITDPLLQKTAYAYDSLGRNISVTDAMGRETLYTYDANGSILSETSPDGGVTSYTYDKKGRLTGITDALSRETTYEYDAFDRIVKETDPLGAVTRYEYDLTGNLTAQTDQTGNTTTYEYDLYGNAISETDANGNRTEYEYDPENRLTLIRDAAGNEASLTYDGNGNLTSVKDPLGATETYAYDKAGRLTEEQSADGGITAYTYDEVGNITAVTDSLLRTTAYQYDGAGNLTKVTNPKGNEVSYTYDARNRQISMTHEDGTKDLFAYDAADNLTAVKEAGERLTEYTYDSMNRCIAVTDTLGNKTSYQYDLCGNLIEETAPDGSRTTYGYDDMDRLTRMTDAGDGVYTYCYDAAGRITKTTGPTGVAAAYEYDKTGNLTSLTKSGADGTLSLKTYYQYNFLNQLVEITDAIGGKTDYTYDKAGNLTGVTYADGATCRYEYDPAGNLTKTTDAAGLCRSFRYDTEGQLLEETSGEADGGNGGLRTYTYSYDRTGNLTAVKDPLGGVTGYTYDRRERLTKTVTPEGTATTYEYDPLSNLTSVTNAEGYRNTYTYDEKGRLTRADIAGEEQYAYAYDVCDRLISVEGETSVVTYQYNATGNLTRVTDGNGQSTSDEYDKAGNLICTTDALGNRIAYTYDGAGNLQSRTGADGSETTYDYDALNRLVEKDAGDALADASYAYDSMGRLVRMNDITGETLYTYDTAGRLLSAVGGDGETLTYAYDIYGNITEVAYPDGGTVTYAYDALDRMSAVTDADGNTTSYEYDKDGNLTRVTRTDGETRIAYDKLGQITGLVNEYEGNTISVYAYAYDGRGNITNEKTRLYRDGQTVEQDYTYTYDGMSQLIRTELTQLTTDGQGRKDKETVTVTYAYDPAGNRLMMQTEADGVSSKTTYAYDEAGRLITAEDSETGLTRYTYDAAGNLVKEEGARTRYYLYDASDRLSAVTDQDNLLLAALYDGNDNRTFMMEYSPGLAQKETDGAGSGNSASSTTGRKNKTGQNAADMTNETADASETGGGNTGSGNDPGTNADSFSDTSGSGENSPSSGDHTSGGWNAFWYGVLCQTADIILPAPTPFKQWLHDKMGFTDDISVLWEEEIYETDFSATADTVRKAENPFDLISRAVADTTGQELAAEAYRQVTYVNDITYTNEQVLVENIINGGMGNSTVAYTYGMQRESYTITQSASSAGNAAAMTGSLTSYTSGTYYYTGTGSVANLVSGGKNTAYTYLPGGERNIYTTGYVSAVTNTYESYGYNGEYTHESLGIQYLRARYYSMATGTFTSKDTYAGRIESILSQNRYTYAENNPVNYADPSGHTKSPKMSLAESIRIANGGNGPAPKTPVNNPQAAAKAAYQSRRDELGLPNENTLLDNIRITNGQERYNELVLSLPVSALMSTVGGSLTFAESVAAKVEAQRCIAYDKCKNKVQEAILIKVKGEISCSNEYLEGKAMEINAIYIHDKLAEAGWTENAIAGILGNMQTESTFNPGIWYNLKENNMNGGFGISQWTPASDYFKWADDNEYNAYDIDVQLERINLEVTGEIYQWQGFRNEANMTFQEFTQSNKTPEELAGIYMDCYERPESNESKPDRQKQARDWYDYFNK